MAEQHPTLIIKKSTELFVVGGVAFDPKANKHIFWYGVRKYPVMPKKLQQETGTKSRTEYIQKFRPEWKEGEEPPPTYMEFYKKLPEVFEEGSPEQIAKTSPEVSASSTIIEPTKIEYEVEATGSAAYDVPVVVEIIKKIRDLIWNFPVEGVFTSTTGLQGDKLKQFINSNLKRAHKFIRIQRFAENFRIIPETTRYIDVATGTIFMSENAVKQAIQEYHAESELMLAASKGGIGMTNIGELLKIADMLDEKGDFESADEIANIIKLMATEHRQVKGGMCPTCKHMDCDCGCDSTGAGCKCTAQKRWLANVVGTLVRVADSLEGKGALKEAQLADEILKSLPQAFSGESATAVMEPPVPLAPASPEAEKTPTPVAPATEAVQTKAPPTTTQPDTNTKDAPKIEAPKTETPQQETPFSQLSDAKNPQEVKIDEPKKTEPVFDELTIDQFKEMIDSMKWRHSQGTKREKYQEVLTRVEKAREYFKAYKEWFDYAHQLFEDEPIRIKIE